MLTKTFIFGFFKMLGLDRKEGKLIPFDDDQRKIVNKTIFSIHKANGTQPLNFCQKAIELYRGNK